MLISTSFTCRPTLLPATKKDFVYRRLREICCYLSLSASVAHSVPTTLLVHKPSGWHRLRNIWEGTMTNLSSFQTILWTECTIFVALQRWIYVSSKGTLIGLFFFTDKWNSVRIQYQNTVTKYPSFLSGILSWLFSFCWLRWDKLLRLSDFVEYRIKWM